MGTFHTPLPMLGKGRALIFFLLCGGEKGGFYLRRTLARSFLFTWGDATPLPYLCCKKGEVQDYLSSRKRGTFHKRDFTFCGKESLPIAFFLCLLKGREGGGFCTGRRSTKRGETNDFNMTEAPRFTEGGGDLFLRLGEYDLVSLISEKGEIFKSIVVPLTLGEFFPGRSVRGQRGAHRI